MTALLAVALSQLADLATWQAAIHNDPSGEGNPVMQGSYVVAAKLVAIIAITGLLWWRRTELRWLYGAGAVVLAGFGLFGAATNLVNGGLV